MRNGVSFSGVLLTLHHALPLHVRRFDVKVGRLAATAGLLWRQAVLLAVVAATLLVGYPGANDVQSVVDVDAFFLLVTRCPAPVVDALLVWVADSYMLLSTALATLHELLLL